MLNPIALAAISAILLAISFPPFGIWPVAWVAFVPLFFALDRAPVHMPGREGTRRAASIGFAFGFVFFLATVYWVVHSMYFYGGVGLSASVPVMLLLVAYLAVYPTLFALAVRCIGASNASGDKAGRAGRVLALLAVPAVWTALEFARGHLFTGFPWVLAGYAPAPWPPLVQIADITGVWGVSFVIVLVNRAIFLALRAYLSSGRGRAPFPAIEVIVAVAVLTLTVAYGFMRSSSVDASASAWRPLRAAVLQGNIDQAVKWDSSFRERTVDIYEGLTRVVAAEGVELVVWPETAVPFYLESDTRESARVRDIVSGTGVSLLTGSPSFMLDKETGNPRFMNSAYLLDTSGEIAGRFDKVHLVPFGEYVPLKRILFFIDKLTAGVGDFVAGEGTVPIPFDESGIGVLICYESIFPVLARGHVKNGAGLLVVITNDAWFGRSSAPHQHMQMSVLRAIENRTYLLRSANTGISAVVDPVGRVTQKTSLFERASIVTDIGIRNGAPTFYAARGDVFSYIAIIFGALMVVRGYLSCKKQD